MRCLFVNKQTHQAGAHQTPPSGTLPATLPMPPLHSLLACEPSAVRTTLLVHLNLIVYAACYWMTLSLLPYMTKGVRCAKFLPSANVFLL